MIKCEHCEASFTNINDAIRYANWRRGPEAEFICPLHKPAGLLNQGTWSYTLIDESRSALIPIVKPNGEETMIRVVIPKNTMLLTHTNGSVKTVSRYKAQGKWRWSIDGVTGKDSDDVDKLLKRLGLDVDYFIMLNDFKSKEFYWKKKRMYCFGS